MTTIYLIRHAEAEGNLYRRIHGRYNALVTETGFKQIACLEARKHYAWYLKGIPYAGYYREKISHISSFEDIYSITKGICRDLK